MKVLIVLAACLALAQATCNAAQRQTVGTQWSSIYCSGQAGAVGKAIFNNIFAANSAARGFFSRVNGNDVDSPEFKAHTIRVLGGLNNCISMLGDSAGANAQLAHLKMQHDTRGIPAGAYDLFKNAAMAVLPGYISGFDSGAWSECIDVIINAIRN